MRQLFAAPISKLSEFSFPFNSNLRSSRFTGVCNTNEKESTARESRNDNNVGLHKADTQPWNPTWLRRPILLATIASLIVAITGLFLLLYFARKTDGIVLHTTNHFSWTYGPTAVLTLLVAVWRQIDYCCKALAPWYELDQGQASAGKSVLLDYKSPLQVVSLYNAAKNRHVTVVVTILGFIVLKLVVLASTGLLFPDFVALAPADTELQRLTKLDGSLYNESANQGLFDPSIVYTAFAVMSKGLPYADGTAPGMVFEQFKLPQMDPTFNGTINAQVQALIPTYHCESAPSSIKLQPANVTDLHPEDKLELLFPECSLRGTDGTSVYALNPQTFVCPGRQLSPLLQQIDCDTGPDNWQLLTLTDFRYSQTITNTSVLNLGDPVSATVWSTNVEKITGVACKSVMSVENIQLSYDFATSPATVSANRLGTASSTTTTMGNFTAFDLGVLTTSALSASADMFGSLIANQYVLEYPNVLFKMMATISGGSYEDLLNETTMISAAEQVLQQVALQAAAKFIVNSESSALPGTLEQSKERLQVSELPFWLMLSGCTIMVAFTLFLILKGPKDARAIDSESINSTALLLANSGEFREVLQRIGNGGDKELDANLKGLQFGLQPQTMDDNNTFSLTISPSTSELSDQIKPVNESHFGQISWWTPLTLKRPILVVSLALPVVSIGVLEALQELSDQNHGFTSLQNPSSVNITILTRFLPALVMLTIATLINALDFNIAVLAPFNTLHSKSGEKSQRIISNSTLGHPPVLALWKSFKYRQWGSLLSSSAAIVGSVLTIVVSGLYTIENLSIPQTVSLDRADQFLETWTNSVNNDSAAAVVTSLTESLGLDYPRYTYDELALPAINSSNPLINDGNSSQFLQVSVPALRGDLECVQLPGDMLNISATYNFRIDTSQAAVSARAPLPPECPFGGANGTENFIEFSNSFSLHGNTSFVGKLLDLHVGPFDPIQGSSFGELAPNTQSDNPPGCPSLAFIYGYADVNNPSKTAVTTLMCYQYIDQIEANVSFALPAFTIPITQPPSVNESSTQRLTSGPNNETAFPFRIQLHMDDEFSSFNQSASSTSTLASSSLPLDNFFQGVLFGQQPLDQALLAGTSASDVSQVFGSIRGFYRRYMAQAISSNMRISAAAAQTPNDSASDSINSAPTLTGTLLNAKTQPRIVQNRTAKIILQVQLGLMFAMASLAVYCSRLRELVPFNPCTIAGVAALFARSSMCDLDDPVGSEVMENHGRGLRNGRYRFKLRRWETGPEGDGDGQRREWYGIDAVRDGNVD